MKNVTTNSEREPHCRISSEPTHVIQCALHYATDRGWRVLPVHSVVDDGSCTCPKGKDCDSPGKHPRIAGWPKKATTNPDVIRRWWEQWPNANVGIACGEESNLAVVDVDPRNGGLEALRELTNLHGELPHSLKVATGGGGEHHYFSCPDEKVPNTKLGAGLDLQVDGAFVVAPPSIHVSGGSYSFKASIGDEGHTDLHPLPAWVIQEAQKVPSKGSASDRAGKVIPEGTRNNTLTSKAGRLRNWGLDAEEIGEALLSINQKRCRPPLSESEVVGIAKSVARYEPKAGSDESPRTEAGDPETGLVVVRASEVEPVQVEWLWPGRIAFGKLNAIVGLPGLGKSTIAIDLAARVTTGGGMPNGVGSYDASNVILLSAEDGAADTIVPRFAAAGGNQQRLFLVEGADTKNGQAPVSFPDYIEPLRRLVAEKDAKLVIVDPFFAYLSSGLSPNSDPDVRRALTPLAKLAEDSGCAILLVHHPNKSSEMRALLRISGSGGIAAALRMALVVGEDPENSEERVLAGLKSNLARRAPSLAYRLESEEEYGVARVVWEGSSPYNAEDLLDPPQGRGPTELDNAKRFLNEVLAIGPVWTEVLKAKRRQAGISERTLERAKVEVGVVSKPRGFGGEWYAMLPEHEADFPENVEDRESERLADSEPERTENPCISGLEQESATMANSDAPTGDSSPTGFSSIRHGGEDCEHPDDSGTSGGHSPSIRQCEKGEEHDQKARYASTLDHGVHPEAGPDFSETEKPAAR